MQRRTNLPKRTNLYESDGQELAVQENLKRKRYDQREKGFGFFNGKKDQFVETRKEYTDVMLKYVLKFIKLNYDLNS
jgi:hypothetical protein